MSRNSVFRPVLIDELGQVVPIRDEDAIEAHVPGRSNAYAAANLHPLGWNHGKPDGSRMVGWTLHRKGHGRIVEQHAFAINPQGITRADTVRNQLFATQAAFYVDDFGPGPITIQLTQFIGHGRATIKAGGGVSRTTARQDVIRFYDLIFTKAVANPGMYDVYFHDNHLWDQINSRSPELVYFPGQSACQIVRNVQQQNVWQLQLTMMTLQAPPPETRSIPRVPGQPKIKTYVVRQGDTLKKIATRLAGRRPTHKHTLQMEQQIIALTRKYGADDIAKPRDVKTYSSSNPTQVVGTVHVTRMHITPGEKIILPSG